MLQSIYLTFHTSLYSIHPFMIIDLIICTCAAAYNHVDTKVVICRINKEKKMMIMIIIIIMIMMITRMILLIIIMMIVIIILLTTIIVQVIILFVVRCFIGTWTLVMKFCLKMHFYLWRLFFKFLLHIFCREYFSFAVDINFKEKFQLCLVSLFNFLF